MRYSHGESDNRGVLIAFREGLNFQIENEIKDKNGRILILEVTGTIQGSNYILINIYNANTEQEQLTILNQLDEFLATIEINRDTQGLFIWRQGHAGTRATCLAGTNLSRVYMR